MSTKPVCGSATQPFPSVTPLKETLYTTLLEEVFVRLDAGTGIAEKPNGLPENETVEGIPAPLKTATLKLPLNCGTPVKFTFTLTLWPAHIKVLDAPVIVASEPGCIIMVSFAAIGAQPFINDLL